MKLVVDTNILFSYFWKESFTRKLLKNSFFELISSDFALEGLKKYSKEIILKIKISKKEFNLILSDLKKEIKFISKKNYFSYIKKAENISPDKNDVEFFALSLKEKVPFWTNDLLLKT